MTRLGDYVKFGHLKYKPYYIVCEIATYVYFLWAIYGIIAGAIVTLPVLFLDCAPVPSCILKLSGPGGVVATANLGDIKNAKQAAAYIFAKKRSR